MGYPQAQQQLVDAKSVSSEIDNEDGQVASRDSYTAWKATYPSALEAFEKMMEEAKGKTIVVFLDYDGTLSPIVKNPDMAVMSDEMRAAVEKVATCFPTAIVSGRSRPKVTEFVKLNNITYAGSHGMDILLTSSTTLKLNLVSRYRKHQTRCMDDKGNQIIRFEPAKEFLPTVQKIKEKLKDKVNGIEGANIEDNKFCISVHFRCVNEKDVGILKQKVETVMKDFPGFRISGGRKVFEIRPSINWDKGRALEYLLETLGYDKDNNIFPVYIGDDKTDEDAFRFINRNGGGFPIVVSAIPKQTEASYSLRDPNDVLDFLTCLAGWKKKSF